jgi:hypothetical protein
MVDAKKAQDLLERIEALQALSKTKEDDSYEKWELSEQINDLIKQWEQLS